MNNPMGSIPSSISPHHPLVREALMAKMMNDLLKIHKDFLAGMKELADHATTIKKLPKGDKGETPTINYEYIIKSVLNKIPTPKDGDTPDMNAIIDEVSKRIRQPKDGETPVINEHQIAAKVLLLIPKSKTETLDHEKLADLVITKISEGKKLKKEHIAGLTEEVASYRSQLAGKVYGKDTMVRGGGDTVKAGTNVTITTDANGKKVINAIAASSTYYTPTGTVDGSNTVFGVTAQPANVIADGITYFEGHGYSYNAGLLQITFDVAPSQYTRYSL